MIEAFLFMASVVVAVLVVAGSLLIPWRSWKGAAGSACLVGLLAMSAFYFFERLPPWHQ